MKSITFLIVSIVFLFATTNLFATFNEEIIWDPNGASGEFTSYPSTLNTVISHIDATADVTVTGGGANLKNAVDAATSGTLADPYVIEVEDGTYTEQVTITDLKNIVIRAADNANPVIDLQSKSGAESAFRLNSTVDGYINNIVIKGFTIKNILYSTNNDQNQGIASFERIPYKSTRIDNLVIEDNVFDNTDMVSSEHVGLAIRLPRVYGLIIRRNEIYNCGISGSNGGSNHGAITLNDPTNPNNYIREVFIQNNVIDFDYTAPLSDAFQDTRGIHIWKGPENNDYFENVYIEYNYIANVQKEGIKIDASSSGVEDDEEAFISNNVLYRVADGIEIDGGTVNIDNCIFSHQCTDGPEGKDMAIDVDGGTVNISNTIVIEKADGIDNAAANVLCANFFNNPEPHPNDEGETVLNLDPQFADESTKDYTINNEPFSSSGCNSKNYGLYFIPDPTGQPVVTTFSVTDIEMNSAESGGNVTEDNGFTVTERGIVYNTTPNPTTADNSTTDGSGTGEFTSNLTGLTPETYYYVRAYAINSEGTGYGGSDAFWTHSPEPEAHAAEFSGTALSASEIGLSFSAANSISDCDGYVLIRSESNPDESIIDDGVVPGSQINSPPTYVIADISDPAQTTYSDTYLISRNKTYQYELIPYNYNGANPETYNYKTDGTISTTTVTTPVEPTVATNKPIGTSINTGKGSLSITNTGNENPRIAGLIYWKYDGNAKDINDVDNSAVFKSEQTGDFGVETIDFSLTGLSPPETRYNVRAYAMNSEGYGYGGLDDFWTHSSEPSGHPASLMVDPITISRRDLSFSPASSIEDADGYVLLIKLGGVPDESSFTDGIEPNSLNFADGSVLVDIIASTSETDYTDNTTLQYAKTYYYALVPYNWNGADNDTYNYNNTAPLTSVSFKSSVKPTVVTVLNSATPSTRSSTVKGNITNAGGEDASRRGILYWKFDGIDKFINSLGTYTKEETGSFGTGEYTINLTGLTPNTLYSYKAYAENSSGISYGLPNTFRTYSELPDNPASFRAVSYIDKITLNFSAPNTTNNCAGYMLIRRANYSPYTANITDGRKPENQYLSTTTDIIANITNASQTSYDDTQNLQQGVTYNYILVPYNWDGTYESTYLYKKTGLPNASGELLTIELSYSFDIFTESLLNDGSIGNNPLEITLSNDTFTSDASDYITITNVPDGLTAGIIRTSSTTMEVSLIGNAYSHGGNDDVNNLTIDFSDGAFTLYDVTDVENSLISDLKVDFYSQPELSYSSTGYEEDATANNGSIGNNPLSVNLIGDTFTANAADYLNISNIPSGLTASKSRVSDSRIEVSLTGNAVNHQEANSIDDLTFTFTAGAFTNTPDADNVINSAKNDLLVRFIDLPNGELAYSLTSFIETNTNDGSIGNNPLTITLSGDTFTADALNYLTIKNIPSGLTVNKTKTTSTQIEVSLTDNANSHEQANSINNLTFTFADDAFTTLNSADVTNSENHALDVLFNNNPALTYDKNSFDEAPANNGSMGNNPLTITLVNDEFTENAVNNLTISNVPTGLTAVITKTTSTEIEVSLTGSANAHELANSINNLTFTFANDAFVNAAAENVANAENHQMDINFNNQPVLSYNKDKFIEDNNNDGGIDNSNPLIITLSGNDTFTSDAGDYLSANNLPAGLSINAVRVNSSTLSVTLTGNATSHDASDSVNDLGFTFSDGAFNNVAASNISNSTKGGFEIEFFDPGTGAIIYSGDTYNESNANDGSIANSLMLNLLGGDKFAAGISEGNGLTVQNLPDYLSVNLSLDATQTELEISLSGSKTGSHQSSNDVSNLTFEFDNNAFESYDASNIVNHKVDNLIIDFDDQPYVVYSSTKYEEGLANDGSIGNTIEIDLTGDTFTGSLSDDFVSGGKIAVNSLPSGLNLRAEKKSNTKLELSITGKADSHTASDSIDDLSISFANEAFENVDIADFAGSPDRSNIEIEFKDNGADEPASQASNIVFGTYTRTSIYARWTRGNGDYNLVLVEQGGQSGLSEVPTDWNSYTANRYFGNGDAIGGSYVVYNGARNYVTVENLQRYTMYGFKVIEYNTLGTSGTENYLTEASTFSNNDNPNERRTSLREGMAFMIQLADFDVRSESGDAYLDWSTSIEENVSGFELYRADAPDEGATAGSNEVEYELIASYTNQPELIAAGNSQNERNYGYIDKTAKLRIGETYLYKLVAVTLDGTKTELGVRELTITGSGLKAYSIKPSPARDYAEFKLELSEESQITVDIVNLTGETVATPITNEFYPVGINEVSIPLEQIATGVYNLLIKTNNESTMLKFVIMK